MGERRTIIPLDESNMEKLLKDLISQHGSNPEGVQASYRAESPRIIHAFEDKIKQAFMGYQVNTQKSYSRMDVYIGKMRKRMDSSRVGSVLGKSLGLEHDEVVERLHSTSSLEEEFGDAHLCPVCHNYLPREAFGSRGVSQNSRRAPYCKRCTRLYAKWRKMFCQEHSIERLTPDYGPSVPNFAFRAFIFEHNKKEGI